MADKKPTQDEIIQEVGEVSSQWNPNDKPEMVDPIIWRDDYKTEDIINWRDPKLIKNWSLNKNAYGDDGNGNPEVDIPEMYGWTNDKYTWTWTRNTFEAYNPNITTADLDPTYKYGLDAEMANSREANYIARRNDMIASALYNEWKTSMQDVAEFLNAQQWFRNSTEWERRNTIAAIWKRIWERWDEEGKQTEEPDLSKADEIVKDTSGKIYWKTTAEEWKAEEGIDTLSDANSVFKIMETARVSKLKDFVSMNPADVAELMLSWTSPYWEQTIRDAQLYYPEFMAEVNAEKKKKIWQQNVTAIASGWEVMTDADYTDTSNENTSYAVNNSTASVSATQLLKSIDSILESSDTAKSAQDLMGSIEKDMATLKNRLKNLKTEASKAFKWDVPDYIVNAYVNNRTQEIQNQLSILEDRYNAAYNRRRAEASDAQWEAEYQLKKDSLALDERKAKNNTTSTSSTTSSNYTVAERNNNPTNMTVWFMQRAWAELGVDYEISSDSFWSNGKQLYYAKLLWDPIETTIRILDKAIANGKNPFNTTSWSYINELWLTVDKWNKMSQEDKEKKVKEWLHYEWWNMDNMAYYVTQRWVTQSFNEDHAFYYQKFLDADYTALSRPEKTAKILGYGTVDNFRAAAEAWKKAEKKRIEEQAANKPAVWKRKDWAEFDISDTPTYDTLTYDQQNIVQQLLNLNKNPATVTKRQYWDDFERILSAVKEINPNWSDSDYWQADKVKKEWNTSSKNGSNSRNGTAIATAKDIYDIADEFGNVKWKDWNGMLNKLKWKLSDEAYTKLLINLEVLASEYAWALKGNNAAPTEQEINDKKEIIAANLGAWAMKEAAIQIAWTLYNKNANEADNYKNVTLVKPPLVVTNDVADWMYDVAWIKSLPDKYQYTPNWTTTLNAPLTWDEYTYEWWIMEAIKQKRTKWLRMPIIS